MEHTSVEQPPVCIDQPAGSPLPPAVTDCLVARGWGAVRSAEALSGGMHSRTLRLRTASGHGAVLKLRTRPEAACAYYRETLGLRALALPGAPRVPEVYAVSDGFLLMEDLGRPMTEPTDGEWERFGRAVAALHGCTHTRFGFDYSGCPEPPGPSDAWMDDGVEHWLWGRLLHYLSWPLVPQTLTTADIRGVLRLADAFRRLVPHDTPALLHGDLWWANAFVTQSGEPALIDPDVHFGLREHDLAIARQGGGIPNRFFDAYDEARPLLDGWRERQELFYTHVSLGLIAYGADPQGHLADLRELVRRYA